MPKILKIYTAMVDAGDTFNPVTHAVEDMQVFNLVISQSEGEFARAKLEIPNPGIGLLSPTRKKYLFISCLFNGSVVPIFAGRVLAFPTDFGEETITVEYIAQPETWADDQTAFLDTLKVAPYYNVLFSDPDKRDDPAEILAARQALLHWSRFPGGGVSLSDIIQGSVLINLGEGALFDSLKTSIGEPPLNKIEGKIEVEWIQTANAEVNVGDKIKEKFVNSGGAPTPRINSLTPKAFEAAWAGVTVPLGYAIKQSVLQPIIKGISAIFLQSPTVVVSSEHFPTKNGDGEEIVSRVARVPRVWYNGILKLIASYSQKRREVLSFSLISSTQEFSLTSDNSEPLSIKLQDPTASVNGSALAPEKPTFFYHPSTHILNDYGRAAIENALLRARARLTKAARVVEASFETAISNLDLLTLTCDMSIRFDDDRLPGGKMRGKVLGYSYHFSDQDQIVEITIGAVIGTGVDSSGFGTVLNSITYENEDTDSIDADMDSKIVYYLPGVPSPSQPIDAEAMLADPFYCIVETNVADHGQSQNNNFAATSRPDEYLNEHGTGAFVDLKSMNPSDELLLEFNIGTQILTLPQHIDLEAA